ncbi:MAG: hypothetical protein PF441_03525 [Desulfuromusa sp.]|jgi:hypothetical protein|nr:hypothetical protein [Desulfuromusa sp.]
MKEKIMSKDNLQIASFIVLLGCSFFLGLLGKSAEMGLSILAGAISLAFLNIDKIKKFKGAGFEAEMREKIEAIIEKETEPTQHESDGRAKVEAYGTNENDQKVIKALNNSKYTWRYFGGLLKESQQPEADVKRMISWLMDHGLATTSQGEHGKLYTLSAKGRRVFSDVK